MEAGTRPLALEVVRGDASFYYQLVNCFTLIQVPAVFAVVSAKVRDLRCGACSVVLSYSYHDPDRKKPVDD
ncbi:hypothetical protein ZWY2020_058606 [Hordeum vulgare]|nr:hypothetical protein ZWY2020_058606 [Hordeum vulgare]